MEGNKVKFSSEIKEGVGSREVTPMKRGSSLIFAIILVLSLGLNGYLYLNYDSLNDEYSLLDESYNTLTQELTIFEINAQQEISEAYDTGVGEGNASGYLLGLTVGEEIGYDSGYETGYGAGDQDGYLKGYSKGYSQGNTTGIEIGYETGFKEGLDLGALGDYEGWGTFVRNPTHDEVLEFIGEDKTDEVEYVEGEFECLDFCMMFRNNAFKKGYISYTVWIDFEGQTFGHTIIGFNTTDRDMVYLDPQLDYFVDLGVGVDYWKDAVLSPQEYGEGYIIDDWHVYF
jgi:hypothetical protein